MWQEELQKLKRQSRESASVERAVVTTPGAAVPAWTIKVLSLNSYNVYNVQMVEIAEAGVSPAPIGNNMQAYNLAESFTSAGNVSAGTYAVMWRVGKDYVFYVQT